MVKMGTLALIAHDGVTCTKKPQNTDVESLLQFAEEIVHEIIRTAPTSVIIRF